jgi:hypothetical protein
MNRPRLSLHALLLMLTATAASWFAMMILHEAGHILAAWSSGGQVSQVVLHPLAFSQTDLADNPHPLFVVWAGPIGGICLPLIIWLLANALRVPHVFLLRFFAGFCLIANGAYLASAAFVSAGDTKELLRLGVPLWLIVTSGAVAFCCGLAIWHRLGSHFGISGKPIKPSALISSSAALVVIVSGMLLWQSLT